MLGKLSKKIEVYEEFASGEFYHENYLLMFYIGKENCRVHLVKNKEQIFSVVVEESEIWFAVNFIQAIMKNDFAEKSLETLYRVIKS